MKPSEFDKRFSCAAITQALSQVAESAPVFDHAFLQEWLGAAESIVSVSSRAELAALPHATKNNLAVAGRCLWEDSLKLPKGTFNRLWRDADLYDPVHYQASGNMCRKD